MTIKEIMDCASPLWGLCGFDTVKDSLIECRAKSRLPENAKTVIVACFPYLLSDECYKDINISKYAVVTDYHEVVLSHLSKAAEKLRELYPNEEFAAFADNSPVPEVRAAQAAGLGVTGLNTLLITKDYGSYVFIGEIVTSLDIEAVNHAPTPCIGCKKCIDACPSGALKADNFDKSLCLSHITQKKGVLSQEEEKLMKECGCVWGCDICQDVCPMNINAKTTSDKKFLASPVARLTQSTPLDGRAYEWRGKKVTDRNLALHIK